jgi:hypothetical protein
VKLGPVVINELYPELEGLDADPAAAAEEAGTALRAGEAEALAAAARFRQERAALQRDQLDRLAEGIPLPQLRLPFLFRADLGPDDVAILAQALRASVAALATTP